MDNFAICDLIGLLFLIGGMFTNRNREQTAKKAPNRAGKINKTPEGVFLILMSSAERIIPPKTCLFADGNYLKAWNLFRRSRDQVPVKRMGFFRWIDIQFGVQCFTTSLILPDDRQPVSSFGVQAH